MVFVLCISVILTDLKYTLIIATLIFSPNAFITKIITRSHEYAVKRDERTNRVVRFEGSYTVLDCEEKGEVPHETSLLVRQ